jgi:hypothetical protein
MILKNNWPQEDATRICLPESDSKIYLSNLEFSVNGYEFYYTSGEWFCYYSFDAG